MQNHPLNERESAFALAALTVEVLRERHAHTADEMDLCTSIAAATLVHALGRNEEAEHVVLAAMGNMTELVKRALGGVADAGKSVH